MSIDLALVGATGAVGRTALKVLAERDFPYRPSATHSLGALGRQEGLDRLGQGGSGGPG